MYRLVILHGDLNANPDYSPKHFPKTFPYKKIPPLGKFPPNKPRTISRKWQLSIAACGRLADVKHSRNCYDGVT